MMGPKKKVMKVSTKTMTQSRGLKTRTAKKAVREPSPSPPSPASSMALDEELAQSSQRGHTPPSEPVQEPDLQADIPDLRQGEKRKREKPIILSEDHEADMADWLKGHPELHEGLA